MPYKLGEVREPVDADFEDFKKLIDDDEGWTKKHDKHGVVVLSKGTEYSSFKMVKVRTNIEVPADVVYDVLHDQDYRKEWDEVIIDGFDICKVCDTSDIGYYSLKAPLAFKNRDFVTMRVWRVTDADRIIFNHSVFHKKMPERKEFVRGASYLTGYLIRPTGPNSCSFGYVTQSNPRGKIPAWAMNKGTTIFAPRIAKRLIKAATKYPKWKATHKPDFKPWLHPQQSTTPLVDYADILDKPDFNIDYQIDESSQPEPQDGEGSSDQAGSMD